MKLKSIALLSFCVTGLACAQEPSYNVTTNVGVYSQYIYRGIAQTNKKPALQGGVDYANTNGFYAGVWGSNISWISDTTPSASASLELDFYGGYKKTFGDFSYDFGALRYQYPGDYPVGFVSPNTTELYGQAGWKFFTLKYSHSLTNTFGVANSKNSYYLDLTGTFPVNEVITIVAHVGHQKYAGTGNNIYSYTDYKLEGDYALTKDWTAGIGVSDTNARRDGYTNGRGVFLGNKMGYAFAKRSF